MKKTKITAWSLIFFLLASYLPGVSLFGVTNSAYASAAAMNIYAPTDLRMAPASNTDTTVVLVWEKPLFYSNIVKYNIYSAEGTLVGSTDKTYYKVLGLTQSTTYSYTVRAQDASGNESLDSNAVQITTKKTGKRFNVKDYGAKGDGVTMDTKAIQAAIDAVTPGDTLYFPAGAYLTGGLFLHSNMTVYVDAGAQIKPSTHTADFLPFVMQRHSFEEPQSYQSLFSAGVMDHTNYGYSVEDIAILGPGTIGDEDNGLALRKEYDNANTSYGGGHLIGFNNAHNIYLDGLQIRNGMMWTIVPVYSKDITAYNLDIDTTQHNGDGFDPNSSENVYILNTTFQTGDDSSAIKSGRDQEGRDIGRPSRFIYYRGDTFSGGHGGVVIGSEMSGGVSDVFVEDSSLIPVDVSSNAVSAGFKVKTSTTRGGYIRNIQVRDSLINRIDLNSNYDKLPVPDIYAPDMSNFRFINLRNNDTAGTGTDNIISLTGAASTPTSDNALKNVQFTNVAFTQAVLAYTENIFFNNSKLTKGISATNSSNIVQDGSVLYDKSFPVTEDFTGYKVGDMPGGYWTGSSYAPGLISIKADGANDPNSLFLDDENSGYVSVSRGFAAQTGVLTAEVSMKFPAPPNLTNGVPNGTYASKPTGNNRVFQLLGSNGKVAVWLNTENSGALSYVINGATSRIVVPAIPLNTWFSVKTVVDYPNKQVDVYYNGTKVLSGLPFYDSTAIPPDINTFKSIGPNNNTTVASQVFLDDLKISAPAVANQGYGINLASLSGAKSISVKGGSLTFSASKTTGSASTVSWAVYNSDLTPTDAAVIDANGVLTAKKNGNVVVAASMNDGTATVGLLPIQISGQESMIGFKPINVTTAVGMAPTLPSMAMVQWDDGSVTPAPVTWDLVDPAQYKQTGTVTIQGTVTGYSQRAAVTVNVIPAAVTGYQPVVVKTTAGVAPKLPDKVTAIYNNNGTQSIPVVWDKVSSDQYAQTDVRGFKVQGTVQGSTLPVIANVSVLPELGQGITPILVAADGSGDYKSIQAAINAVPDQNISRSFIFIKNGVYYEKVLVPETKSFISLIGESEDGTILTYDDNPKKTAPDGTTLGLGTFNDYTIQIKGHDFTAKNMTFKNTSGSGAGQAVAVDVYADKASFYNTKITAYQDTLLTRNLTDNADPTNYANNHTVQTYRSYFKDSYISGSVDFIFGPGTAVFENSELRSRLAGHVTAASTPQGQKYGYVFLNDKVTSESLLQKAAGTSDLGRPWRPYAQTVYLNTYMQQHISPTGWNNFGNASNEATAYYAEYNSSGPGANPTARLSWTHQLTDEQAQQYTIDNIFSPSGLIGGGDMWYLNDTTPPVTTATASPIDGKNGWYVSSPSVALAAADDLSGVAQTVYRIDGGNWNVYSEPLTITSEGIHTFEFKSIDKAGNEEPAQKLTIQLDRTPPTLNVVLDKTTLWPADHKLITVNATLDASDAVSQIDSVVLTSIVSNEPDSGLGSGDEPNDIQGAELGTTDTSFLLRAERSAQGAGRTYTITYTATDMAGNKTVVPVTVTVPHDQGDPDISLASPSVSTVVNNPFTVIVKGSNLSDLYAYEMNLTYDKSKLQFVGYTAGNDGFTVDPVFTGDGVQLAHTETGSKAGLTGDAALAVLTFKPLQKGETKIALSSLKLVNSHLDSTVYNSNSTVNVVVTNSASNGSSKQQK